MELSDSGPSQRIVWAAFGGGSRQNIQEADVPTGYVMCYVQAINAQGKLPSPEWAHAFRLILELAERECATGLNYVVSHLDFSRLGFLGACPVYAMLRCGIQRSGAIRYAASVDGKDSVTPLPQLRFGSRRSLKSQRALASILLVGYLAILTIARSGIREIGMRTFIRLRRHFWAICSSRAPSNTIDGGPAVERFSGALQNRAGHLTSFRMVDGTPCHDGRTIIRRL